MNLNLSSYEDLYDSFDASHNRTHLLRVRRSAMKLAETHAPDDADLVYAAATLHDVGLSVSRDGHEEHGARIVSEDSRLREWFGDRFHILVEAVAEHRASSGRPESAVAKIVSDADRSSDTTGEKIERALRFSIHHNHQTGMVILDHLTIALGHLLEKYSDGCRGRRVYFPETDKLMADSFRPILSVTSPARLWSLLDDEQRAAADAAIENAQDRV